MFLFLLSLFLRISSIMFHVRWFLCYPWSTHWIRFFFTLCLHITTDYRLLASVLFCSPNKESKNCARSRLNGLHSPMLIWAPRTKKKPSMCDGYKIEWFTIFFVRFLYVVVVDVVVSVVCFCCFYVCVCVLSCALCMPCIRYIRFEPICNLWQCMQCKPYAKARNSFKNGVNVKSFFPVACVASIVVVVFLPRFLIW